MQAYAAALDDGRFKSRHPSDHNTGETELIAGDSLAIASTNVAADGLAGDLKKAGISFLAIGNCAAPRQAPYAFHEGRKAGLQL